MKNGVVVLNSNGVNCSKKQTSALVQDLTVLCSCIGRVQASLLDAELVSDKYTIQSRL